MSDKQIVRCECGFEVVGAGENSLVEAVRTHAHEAHGIDFTAVEALLVVFRSQLHSPWELAISDGRTSPASLDEGGET